MMAVIFPFAGGVGLFLIGMMLLSRSLVAFAGEALRKGLVRFTGTTPKAFTSGALLTAMMQSSTATTVTLIGFVSAGLISFSHAIGVVMGASLGNSAASWVVSGIALKVNLSFYTMPLIGVGALCKLLSKKKLGDLGMAVAGFGILFLGLHTIQEAMTGLTAHVDLAALPMGGLGAHLIILLIGLAMTAILQSSTAAIATTLTAVHAGAISLDQAASVIVGAAIGTTLTTALVSIGANTSAKRTALAHVLFNLVAGLVAILLLPLYLYAVTRIAAYFNTTPGAVSLAAFHSLFILLGALLFAPFIDRFAHFIERLLPEKADNLTPHLDDSLLGVPGLALEAAQRTIDEISEEFFILHGHIVSNTGYPKLAQVTPQVAALETVFDFITRIQVEGSTDELNAMKVAQLHAVDHLIRLAARQQHFLEDDHHINQRGFAEAVDVAMSQLQLIEQGLATNEPADWVEQLEQKSEELKAISAKTRAELLKRHGHHTSNRAILLETDNYRWLERNGHHIWRIGYYLSQTRQVEL